jgi:hypothetical protein
VRRALPCLCVAVFVLLVHLICFAQCGDYNYSKCTQYNNTFYSQKDGRGGPLANGNGDHSNGDHDLTLSTYTTPQQYMKAGCSYTGAGYNGGDGCYECNTTGQGTIPYGYTAEDTGTISKTGYQHCISPQAATHSGGPITSYVNTAASITMAITEVPTGTSCSGNGVNISMPYNSASNTYMASYTAQGAYPVYWTATTTPPQVNETCPYEESINGTPVVLAWEPFKESFTGMADGVKFDFFGDGTMLQVSWTKPNVRVAFLVLPDQNGNVTSETYNMFGNTTHQKARIGAKLGGQGPGHPYKGNGFEALRLYDANGDEVINSSDAIWPQLRLWFDYNHNGVVDPGELKTLDEIGVVGIDIGFKRYHDSREKDVYGNVKGWVSEVTVRDGFQKPDIYDVVLQMTD